MLKPLHLDGFYVVALSWTSDGWFGMRIVGCVELPDIPIEIPRDAGIALSRPRPFLRRFVFRGRATEF